MKPTGRPPKGKNKKVLMALRFKPETAAFIRAKARRERIPQARVIEIALTLNGKAVRFNLGATA